MDTEGWLCETRAEQKRVLGYTWTAYAWLRVCMLESGRRVIAGRYPCITCCSVLVISADSVMLAADDACQVEEVGSRVVCLHLPAP